MWDALRRVPVLLAVALGWMLFYFEDLSALGEFLQKLFTLTPATAAGLNRVLAYLPISLIAALASTPLAAKLYSRVKDTRAAAYGSIPVLGVLLLLCVAALATQSYNPFIYFRF